MGLLCSIGHDDANVVNFDLTTLAKLKYPTVEFHEGLQVNSAWIYQKDVNRPATKGILLGLSAPTAAATGEIQNGIANGE